MLTVFGGSKGQYCDRISRRNFLQIGGMALGGLTLPQLLQMRAEAAPGQKSKLRSVIMVILAGGPSHIDMYDPKPDAPAEYRGEFQPINTNVPGIQFSEMLPLQAQLADKMSIVRSMRWFEPMQHELSEVFTGFTKRDARPSFGSTVSRLYAGGKADLPRYVSLSGFYNEGTRVYEGPAYLGASHRPFYPHGPAIEDLKLTQGITIDRLNNRKNLLSSLDRVRRDIDAAGEFSGMDGFTHQAFDMLASSEVQQAFDISKESPKAIERYGSKDHAKFLYGKDSYDAWDFEPFVRARRLAEAGVPVITLRVGTWDYHGAPATGPIFPGLRSQLPLYDRSVSALISDLHERGLQDEVAVVVWGEFGRTPRINNGAGRDHWPDAGFALVSGGGFKMGQAIGATNSRGERPVTREYTPQSLFSTLYRGLGINPETKIPNHEGRPMYVLEDREPISELL